MDNRFHFTEYDGEPVIFTFDESEAKGAVAFTRGGYGVWMWLPGLPGPVALIDLFYMSPEGQRGEDPKDCVPQIVIHDGSDRDDPVAAIKYYPEGPRVALADGVTVVGQHSGWGKLYGRKNV